jgi:hypothetical protein
MSKLTWDVDGTRFYEAGVDRGVLYVSGQPGVAWSGLRTIVRNPGGGDTKSYFVDGVKFAQSSTPEDFDVTISAYTYPPEFGVCDGTAQPKQGLFLTQQKRKSFGLCYRSRIGNDQTTTYAYKLHIIYNALAAPSIWHHKSHGEIADSIDFSWKITSVPSAFPGHIPTGHVVIDSRYTLPGTLALIESVLYGTADTPPRLPTLSELSALFDSVTDLTVTDNGDGTWTAVLPDVDLKMLDDTTFQITWPTATFTNDTTYTLGP